MAQFGGQGAPPFGSHSSTTHESGGTANPFMRGVQSTQQPAGSQGFGATQQPFQGFQGQGAAGAQSAPSGSTVTPQTGPGAARGNGPSQFSAAPSQPFAQPFQALGDPATQMMASMAMSAGKQAVQSGLAAYVPGMHMIWQALRLRFQVDTSFVVQRMRTLLFPFTKKDWKRKEVAGAEQAHGQGGAAEPGHAFGQIHQPHGQHQHHHTPPGSQELSVFPPVEDPNQLDLYLPAMSLVTYVLLFGLLKGTQMEFTPEMLSEVATTCVVATILEVGLLYVALSAVDGLRKLQVLDLLALCGCKYLGLIVNFVAQILAGLFGFGDVGYYVALAYTGACTVRFVSAALGACMPQGSTLSVQGRANLVVLGLGVLQIPLMLWLGYGASSGLSLWASATATGADGTLPAGMNSVFNSQREGSGEVAPATPASPDAQKSC